MIKKYWFSLNDKIRFLFVGGFNFCVAYLLYVAFCLLLGNSMYQFALVLDRAVSSIVSFTTQKLLVFKGGNDWIKEYLKCCTTWFFSYVVNAVLLEVFVKYIHMNVFISQFIATLAAAVCTYILFKKFAFRSKGVN